MIKTLPFNTIPREEQELILENLRCFTGGVKSKVTDALVKTAIKSVVHVGSTVRDVPRIDTKVPGIGIFIPVRNESAPAFTTVKAVCNMM